MGDLFRSEDMQLVQLFIQYESAHDTVDELGQLGKIQFRDLNPDETAFQRNFVNEVKRCDEMERRAGTITSQIAVEKQGEDIIIIEDVEDKGITMDQLEARLEQEEAELLDAKNNTELLERNKNELTELKHVLEKDSTFFSEAGDVQQGNQQQRNEERVSLLDDNKEELEFDTPYPKIGLNLGFITGVIEADKLLTFERVLWRTTRGNLFMKTSPIDEAIVDPHTREEQLKTVFIIFFQGQRIQNKIKKICEAFKANIYPCPDKPLERQELLSQVNTRLQDLDVVLEKGKQHKLNILHRCAKEIFAWEVKIKKEKAIYHTMNMFDFDHGRKCLIAEGWCPKAAINDIQVALRRATERAGSVVPSILSIIQPNETPPTYYKTNKYTNAYQEIVDAYGVSRYKEVNPTVFTIMTFPFLFAVMYGDVGHGTLILLGALALLANEKSLSQMKLNEIVQMMFDGRYVLLMMGIGAIYTGALYNEVFAIPMDLFGTQWGRCPDNPTNPFLCRIEGKGVYPFGVDPSWKGAKNELIFTNSLKMKMSVIFGVMQMLLGIFMHLLNGVYFRKWYNVFFEFIPQFLFLFSIFGYMDFLIFYKWLKPWEHAYNAPMIMNILIQMFLQPTSPDAINLHILGPWQKYLQIALILTAAVCIPLMLLPKPLLLRRDAKRGIHDNEHGHGEEFEFGEVFIHQLIHTIEFVLGSISNTASYLRLWALSLAHAELSIVFWDKIFVQVMSISKTGNLGFIFMFIGFAVWAGFTIGVLIIMESLSAFLHALRLHWVEFQNKFYDGDGTKFTPFSYVLVLAEEEDN